MPDLLPCPICSYHARRTKPGKSTKFQREAGYGDSTYGVECAADLDCGCKLNGFPSQECADDRWNTRTPFQTLPDVTGDR